MSLRIAILSGGISSEREVALESAASVKQAIGKRAAATVFDFPKDIDAFLARRSEFDCAIPVFHGRGGEDGTVQGFLETLGMPYIFSGVSAQALAIDKVKTNKLVTANGIHVPPSITIKSSMKATWVHDVVTKPVDGGSSVGISIAHNQKELDRGIHEAAKWSTEILIEDYIAGREFSVAVIDIDGKTEALPVVSIESKHEFFDYQSKYEVGLANEVCPADIPKELSRQLQQTALTVHRTIGARHVTRSDFIVDANQEIWFLDVNTIPGMSVLLPMPIRASGRDFGEVLMGWVEEAVRLKNSDD
ncbi:MAG: D-alanine--D-alanine ligase [Patescibacteria group bacterium]